MPDPTTAHDRARDGTHLLVTVARRPARRRRIPATVAKTTTTTQTLAGGADLQLQTQAGARNHAAQQAVRPGPLPGRDQPATGDDRRWAA